MLALYILIGLISYIIIGLLWSLVLKGVGYNLLKYKLEIDYHLINKEEAYREMVGFGFCFWFLSITFWLFILICFGLLKMFQLIDNIQIKASNKILGDKDNEDS